MTCAGAVADRSDELRAGVAASFEAAGSASVVRLDLADDAVELRFAGESLRDRLTPAFAHVAVTR